MEWETVIGLEIHTQLLTRSKLFSGSSMAFGAEPNTQACAEDLAMPGTLPVFNAEALRLAVRFGTAIKAEIGLYSVFDRKHYFYPDLPSGYQTSQFEHPIVGRGQIEILVNGTPKTIGITRAHLEEDAGKSLHEDFHGMTGIDLNRAGSCLLEIVSEPDIRSAAEAVAYAKAVHQLVRWLDISDGNMQEGSFRYDANISVRPKGQKEFGIRAEIKNLNSFRFLERAINYEVDRHIQTIESGGTLVQETRLYDPDRDETRSMRSKEEATDYRYFPDPNLLPIVIDTDYVETIRAALPELPAAKRQRFVESLGLSPADAEALCASRNLADYFEAVVGHCKDARLAANWIMVELGAQLNKDNLEISDSRISAEQLGGLLRRIQDQTLSGKLAKQVFEAIWAGEGSADEIIAAKGLTQITDSSALQAIVDQIIADNPKQVQSYRTADPGKQPKMLGFFVGQVMKQTQGKANPQQVNELLLAALNTAD